MENKRVYVERKVGFDVERNDLYNTILSNFAMDLKSLRYINIYDVFNIDGDIFQQVKSEILAEPNKDTVTETLDFSSNVIAYEFLPGQFDQRADSTLQCIKLIQPSSQAIIKSGHIVMFNESVTQEELETIKKLLINKVESREKDLKSLKLDDVKSPDQVTIINGFITFDEQKISEFHQEYGLAMTLDDLIFVQDYFKNTEKRNPYVTEIKVLDTYWSDHCRHTTFETSIHDVNFDSDYVSSQIEHTFLDYLHTKELLGRSNKPTTLMDIATINARLEKQLGNLNDLEVSEEINAASIYIDVDVNGVDEKWLLMFKNETHNHPTEIEPFGGASTCIGGAIRDPLSGRSFVYSAMRVTGAGDITEDIRDTLDGKLPQKVISKVAAQGYSSYGNQIGLATTFVNEIYHPGYVAKRMEIGAVIGAVPLKNVRRETPVPGDVIILLGGRTGRDGIGGATGSSKTHKEDSIESSSAEVQKGNAPEERKIQRLFRNEAVTKLIKKSNDFGAGGVSVAIGELADGLEIDLDKVPTKYDGINGTELAISESQERMSVVIEPKDVDQFLYFCEQENIEATVIAFVTDKNRLVMKWNNQVICDLSREFINTSGVRQETSVTVKNINKDTPFYRTYSGNGTTNRMYSMLEDLNVSSQQGLVEMFDSTIGRSTVLAPYGGEHQLTKTQCSIHKLPVLHGKTNTVSMMAYGFNPYISDWNPYYGSQYAIIESMSKIVASGGKYQNIRFTFQEYFEKLHKDELKWAKPFSALLGAYKILKEFRLAAIGGKDSMSGSYLDLNVPPTLVSFAVTTAKIDNIISNEFKAAGNYIYVVKHTPDKFLLPNFEQLKDNFEFVYQNISNGNIVSAYAVEFGGIAEAIIKASFGNKVGVDITTILPIFKFDYGSIIIESTKRLNAENVVYLGKTINEPTIFFNDAVLPIDECIMRNQKTMNKIYPILHKDDREIPDIVLTEKRSVYKGEVVEKVKVLIPVFPGTNCEYDSLSAFEDEGAEVDVFVFNNLNDAQIEKSINEFSDKIRSSHILMLVGGFSSGDEPDGSGKFIASVLRNQKIKESIEHHLKSKRLILGICNGFQALVKAGLLPHGEIKPIDNNDPTLFKNDINRHISKFVNTKVSSVSSPWLTSFEFNEVHTIAMSHGEGKFICSEADFYDLVQNNQIAFQYVDSDHNPTYHPKYNPNGSSYAIEGIISKDGLILGKMGHSERYDDGLFINISGNKTQNIFKNAADYFKGERK